MQENVVCLSNLFTVVAADNVDHDPSTKIPLAPETSSMVIG